LQHIEFLESQIEPGSALSNLQRDDTGLELAEGVDFVSSGGCAGAVEQVTAPLVFVGYGVKARITTMMIFPMSR
jgi:hypothetical protein